LQIAVHCEDVIALRVVEPGGKRRGLAEVAAQFDDDDATTTRLSTAAIC
jgi:hypothetical protein